MTRRFMIHKHPHVITATEIRVKGSTGIVDSVMRFNSLDELVGHFTGLGASVEDLKEIYPLPVSFFVAWFHSGTFGALQRRIGRDSKGHTPANFPLQYLALVARKGEMLTST